MVRVLWLVWVVSIGGCDLFLNPPTCSSHESAVFISAWEEQLTEKGIPYSKKSEKTLCFEADQSNDWQKARSATEPVYRGAATIVETAAEKGKLFEYMRREKREYDENPLDGGRIFVVVYSGSRGQLEETQVMFRCIKYEKDCLQ